MQQTIVPDKQSVESCLKDKSYHIDFYQREYVWNKDTALTLLDDIFYHFNLGYERNKDIELEHAIEKYSWYYLNVYITNRIDGKNYIVDGQQRLSTLTLIATKLYHKLSDHDDLRLLLGQCIFSSNGFKKAFNLDHEKRSVVMDCIFNNREYKEDFKNKTEENLVARYGDISNYIDEKFKHEKTDSKKLSSFAFYFLKRLVLVELSTTQENMPMVFEVINDRGEALKPFEILKGKLIGALNKEDTESFCDKWDRALLGLSSLNTTDLEDDFFRDFIKSKFLSDRNSSLEKAINHYYHRHIFADNDIAKELALRPQDPNRVSNIKRFIDQDVAYYAELYAKIRKNDNEFLFYANKINYLNGQYQLILSACEINDKNESQKIEIIAKEYDRLWMLLNLNGIYDSNEFQKISYALNQSLKNADISEYQNIFDDLLKEKIKDKNNLLEVHSLLEYESFKARSYRNMNRRILRYLFARVEEFICEQTKQTPQDSVLEIATKKGEKSYQIEHILSRNETNIGYFESEEEFEIQRNLLGGLLLLKGKVNVSSGNEEFQDKLKTYSSSLVWGHSLCQDFYHNNKDFLEFNQKLSKNAQISFRAYDKFDKIALSDRSKLLYEIVKIIWEVER